MKYVKKDMGAYNLHIINTDKFKSTFVKVMFRRKIEKNEITMRNVLSSLLAYSNKEYDSKRKMNIKCQDLYSAAISSSNRRVGNYINTIFSLTILNDKYTKKNNFKDGLKFLNDIIFNPDVENNKFKQKYIDIILNNIKSDIESLKEEAATYCSVRALESFDKNGVLSYRMTGYIEDFPNITGDALYNYYKDMINKDLVDIFVLGNVDNNEVIQDIKSYFNIRTLKKQRHGYYLPNKKPRAKRLIAREKIDNSQSIVNMICRYPKLSDYELYYVLPMYTSILGGSPDSKLFKEVREKNSLCYYISSSVKQLDNIMVIRTGIDYKNYSKCLKLTEKNMNDMKKGKFTNEDIDEAKEFFDTLFDEAEERPNSLIDLYMDISILGLDDLDEKRKKMKRVTKNEIVKVAKKIKMDTIFILEGDSNEKK